MWDKWWQGPRQIRLIFLAVMILLASTLGCVAWWLLDQDQQLEAQRLSERQDAAADLAVAFLEKRFSDIEQELSRILAGNEPIPVPSPSGAVFVSFRGDVVRSWPEDGLVYRPIVRETPEVPDSLFTKADELEFQKQNYSGAIAALRDQEFSKDPRVHAAAFARLSRNYRKAGRIQEALKAASQLADLGSVQVAGMPAALAGGLSALYVYEQSKQRDALVAAGRTLAGDLNSGRWEVAPAAYATLSRELRRLLGDGEKLEEWLATPAAGVEWLWDQWNRDRSAFGSGRGFRNSNGGARPALLLWKSSENAVAGFAAGYIESEWLAELKPQLDSLHVQLVLADERAGKTFRASGRPAIKLASETGLPWTIQVFSTGNEADEFVSRRRLLIAGMAVLAMLILTGTWFIGHAVSRELAVARLQTDFVSTVSHEFRTPLTTLCQLSELLKRDRIANDNDRRQYYELLYTESHRLRRLVEALLNFGRLEAGKLQFHFEQVDAAAFVRQSAAEFIEAQQTHGHRLEIETPEALTVSADRETLRCVFWNLFENAVKYSPGCDTVWVTLSKKGAHVEIEVRDRGVGIPSSEHRRIFEKFVRGTTAHENNIGGTGIGLAMARQIVRAHGGDITLESEPGKGSTFRVVLPEMQANA